MKNAMVSIIVPVYNVSCFLPECIKSVLAQSFMDWELILVNDGSTDDSGEICDTFAAADSRIKVIHKQNTGVSDSRNRALDMATGKYILFLDADDFWCSDVFLEEMVKLAEEENLDIVRGEYKEVTESSVDYRKPSWPEKRQLENQWLSSSVFFQKAVAGEYFACLCLLRSEKIGPLRFESSRIYMEDADFLLRVLQQNLKCVYLPVIFYAYRKRVSAVTSRWVPLFCHDAFCFMETAFSLSLETDDENMQKVLVEEGVRWYIPYLRGFAHLPLSLREKMGLCKEWHVNELKKKVAMYMRQMHRWRDWGICSMPLMALLVYFREKYVIKEYVKTFLGRKR
jgi:glycosyltransferase involved in cell wall biosynthesis